MKKCLSLLLAVLMIASAFSVLSFAETENTNYPHKLEKVHVRDPYVLYYDGLYYMYGTGLATTAGYGCRVSPDLENWSDSYNVFVAGGEGFDGVADYWAPECHYYNGNFYLFASYRSGTTGFRGTSIFKSASPLGPFVEISDGHVTPHTSDNIDGTLFVDDEGQPWIIYVCEWTASDDGIGRMAVAKLSDDLSHMISEPKEIFRADDPIWGGSVTDGPCVYKTADGGLQMLWSTHWLGYCVGLSVSENGKIDGNWKHDITRVYSEGFYLFDQKAFDGGHPMLFETADGRLMMAIHSPNEWQGEGENQVFEHAVFFEMTEKNGKLCIAQFNAFNRLLDTIRVVFEHIGEWFEDVFNI